MLEPISQVFTVISGLLNIAGLKSNFVKLFSFKPKVSETQIQVFNRNITERMSRVRTVLSVDTIDFFDLFWEPKITLNDTLLGKNEMSVGEVSNFIQHDKKQVLLSASAGAGKSLLCTAVALTIARGNDCVPIIYDLRKYDDNGATNYLDVELRATLKKFGFDEREYYKLKKNGQICVILDGLDEVKPDFVGNAVSAINAFFRSPDKVGVLLTSRSGIDLPKSENCISIEIKPQTADEFLLFISRLLTKELILGDYRVIEDNIDYLFSKYESILVNRFLSTLFVIGLGDNWNKSITKIRDGGTVATMYELAFEELLALHDARKVQRGERPFRRNLAIDANYNEQVAWPLSKMKREWAAAVGHVAYQMYINGKLFYLESQLRKFCENALRDSDIANEPSLFMEDLLRSIGLFQVNNNKLGFIHRSFLDYFTAYWIESSENADSYYKRTKSCEGKLSESQLWKFLNEMNSIKFGDKYLQPRLKEAKLVFERSEDLLKGKGAFPILLDKMSVRNGKVEVYNLSQTGQFLNELDRFTLRYNDKSILFIEGLINDLNYIAEGFVSDSLNLESFVEGDFSLTPNVMLRSKKYVSMVEAKISDIMP